MKWLLMTLGAMSFCCVSAFGSETAKGAKKDYETFKQEMSAKLDSLEKQIGELKTQATTKGSEAKSKTVKELETARDNLKAKLDTLSEDGKKDWEKVKKGMSDLIASLNAKVQKALKE